MSETVRRSKSQQFLEGRSIVGVKHSPNKISIILDNGGVFQVSAWIADFDSVCLDFQFVDSFIDPCCALNIEKGE
jgi:hypothetical protein